MKTLCPATGEYKNNFDFTRVILATLVVFCHSYVIYYGNIEREPLWCLSKHQLSIGTCAINFFFMISGFLVSQSWNRRDGYFSFLMKRVLRIYPGFILVCIFCIVLFAPLGLRTYTLRDIHEYWAQINLRHLLFTLLTLREPVLPETFKSVPFPNSVNVSLWSILYEFICYQVIPLFAILGAFNKPIRALAIFGLVLASNLIHYQVYQLYNTTGTFWYDLAPYYPHRYFEQFLNFEHLLLPFITGIVFYNYRHYLPRSRYLLILSSISLIVAALWVPYFEITQSIFGAYILFYFLFNEQVTLQNFARYGDFSYGIYLYGWPLQQLIMLYIGRRLNVFCLFLASMLLVLPLAALSWHLIEKPFLRLKSKVLYKLNTP
jgi:peptidoglycan/LPS O-acetylase OafA/YrhL